MGTVVPPSERMHDFPPHILTTLTRSSVKARLFGVDTYFREAVWTFNEQVGEVLPVALAVLKPEAAAGRRLRPALHALLRAGFYPVDVVRFRHTRLTIRETWRYQLNLATRERIGAMDLCLQSTDSVLVVLWDDSWGPGAVPGAVRLASIKGPAAVELRRPEHLRASLGTGNGLFNFVHTADEPIDLLRDLGLLCAQPRRALVRERIRQRYDALAEVEREFDKIETAVAPHDLDPVASWRRLAKSRSPAGELGRRQAKGGVVTAAELLVAARHPEADPRDHWDVLSVLTDAMPFSLPSVERIYPNVLLEAWQDERPGRDGQASPLVCICSDMSEGALVDWISRGVTTVEGLIARSGAGQRCGDCVELLAELIDEYARPARVGAHSANSVSSGRDA